VERPNRSAWPSERELCAGLSHRLKGVREQEGLSQAELARRLGLSRSSIAKYEAGAHIPGVRVLVRLASGLGVSVDYLVGLRATSERAPRAQDELGQLLGLLEQVKDPDRRAAMARILKGLAEMGRGAEELRRAPRRR
jgi:transcriptional regulator with XRE-family HTH domain